MPDREELMYLVTRALVSSRTASELQEATDQGHGGSEWCLTYAHGTAAVQLEDVVTRLRLLRDTHRSPQS
jgi:hypothetical protein